MKILQLNIAEFGGLKNKVIELDGGLNILSGANESGKSTVMLFIRFMLYGLPKKGSKGLERERALSWDNRRAEGSMLVQHKDRQFRIERRTVSAGARLNETLSTTDLKTGETLEGEPGQIFFGVPAEIFESSCAVSQMRTADVSGDKASSAIENMLVSADESIDIKRVLAVMDKVRKEYKLNRGDGGVIYDTERQISDLRVKLRDATDKHLKYNEMSARLSRSEKNLERIAESHKNSSHMLEQINSAVVLRRFEELDGKKEELVSAKRQLAELEESEKRGELLPTEAHASALKSARLALNEAEVKLALRRREYDAMPDISNEKKPLAERGEEIRRLGGKDAYLAGVRELDRSAASKRSAGLGLCVGGAVLAAIGAALAAVHIAATVAACAVGVILLILGVASVAGSKKLASKRDTLCEELGAPFGELDAYAESCLAALAEREEFDSRAVAKKALLTASEEEVREKHKKLFALLEMTVDRSEINDKNLPALSQEQETQIGEFCKKRAELSKHAYAMNLIVENTQKELSGYDRAALCEMVKLDPASLTPESIERAKRAEKYDRERYDILDKETRNLREALAALGGGLTQSPVEIADRISELEEKLKGHTEYYEALMLAKAHIEEAETAMSGNVTPAIGKKAGELLSFISGGAHSSVQASKNLDLTVEQDGFHVDVDMLSGGAKDAAYICLRISLMLRLFGSELPPLIMDESLCQLDDTRAANMLTLLSGLSETATQCILLTCHSRESEMCKDLGIKVKNIRI